MLARAIADLGTVTMIDEEEPLTTGGGSGHDLEREPTPLRTDEHHRCG